MDVIQLPNAISLPTAFGAPPPPFQPGQVVQALVLELIESDIFRLQLPQAIVDVRSDVALDPGSTVTLAVKAGGANARLAIYADNAAPKPQPAGPVGQAPSVAGRQPIGEAVVVARAPVSAPNTPVEVPVARVAPSITPPRAVSPSPQPQVTPERALGEAVSLAATRQSGLAPLFADVAEIAKAPPSATPELVRAAAQQIAALRVPLDEKLTAADVKQAFVRSGVLLEPKIAAARAADLPQSTSSPKVTAPKTPAGTIPATTPSTAPVPANDLKAALLVFRQVLKTWADDTAPVRAAPSIAPSIAQAAPDRAEASSAPLADSASIRHLANALAGAADELLPEAPPLSPEQATSLAKSIATQLQAREAPDHPAMPSPNGGLPPPYRGAPLSAQPAVAAAISPDTLPHEAAERLLAQTDGAIARTTLLQAASLPDQPAPRNEQPAQRWIFEVPFAAPQGTAVAQFEVSRDGRGRRPDAAAPVWRARFSLDVEPMGPVHALVALSGARASVTLWAERHATAARLNDNAATLGEALRAAELEPADFQFRVGAPPAVARQAAPGRFMDRAT